MSILYNTVTKYWEMDTNHLPWWLAVYFSSSSWWRFLFNFNAILLIEVFIHSYLMRIMLLPMLSSLAMYWYAQSKVLMSQQLLVLSDIVLELHSYISSWVESIGDNWWYQSNPATFCALILFQCGKHLLALRCITLFKHEGKPFGECLVVSSERGSKCLFSRWSRPNGLPLVHNSNISQTLHIVSWFILKKFSIFFFFHRQWEKKLVARYQTLL